MARNRSSKSYEDRLQALNPQTRHYIELFLESEHGKEKSYKSQIFLFVEYFNSIPINEITPNEIKEYLLSIDSKASHIVNVARFLTFFLSLIPSQEENILQLTKTAQEKLKEIKNKEPISIDDVITFRNKLIADNDYKTLFVFEMLYVYGLKWKDFKSINLRNYLPKTGELLIKSKGTIQLTKNLRDLLISNPKILKSKSYGVLASYLRDASSIFENRITETVIEETRKKYFPTCQCCNKQYPNTSEYWVLVECKEDMCHDKWLLCISCAKGFGG